MTTFYVENFGCRATQADGAAIERQFRERGLTRSERASQAKIVVLNTCTVTASADRDARAAIRRVQRENPTCQIVVTGCYAQRAPAEIASLPGVSKVIGNSHKHRLADIALSGNSDAKADGFVPVAALRQTQPAMEDRLYVSDIFAHTELLAAPVVDAVNERTRPNLKVQDGCDNRCSFCVIPSVRGQSRSLPLKRVLSEIDTLVASGYCEVVISGINLGRWGRDLPGEPRFEELVRTILHETALQKLRVSSVEPMDWSDELIALIASSPRIAKHAHVPMQSGSDRILRLMRRKYRPWHYREKIEKIRQAMPTAAIGADVMVGFPGETERDFEETRRMIEDLPFTYLHVFTYSPRPGTHASSMSKQIESKVAQQRNRILRDCAAEKKLEFMQASLGKTVVAITLKVSDGLYTECLTDNYLPLRLRGVHAANRWILATIDYVGNGELIGAPAEFHSNNFASSAGLSTITSGGSMLSVCGAKP